MKINDVLLTEGWRDEADDFSEWSDYVREKLSKSSNEQRLGLAKKLSQLEVKHFGSTINGGFDRATGKPTAGLGLTDTVKQILKSFGSEAEYTRQANAALNPQDGPAGNFSMPFGSVDVAGLEGASPEVLRVMKKAVMLGADVAAAARNFYKKHGTLTDQDLPKIQMSLANNASAEWKQQHSMAEGMERAVDAEGRTQEQWLALVKAEFPDGGPVTVTKLIQAKMIDGPMIASLSNGKQIGWKKVEKIDEILNPTGLFAGIIRWAVDNPVIVAGLGVAGVGAAVGVTGGMAALGPLISAATGVSAGQGAVGLLTLDKLKDIIQSNPNQAENWFKQQIYKYIGDEADAKEFSLLHAKTAYLDKEQMFRWRAKEWPVTMKREEAEAFLEKTEKFWLDSEKQKAIDAEKAKEQGVAEGKADYNFDIEDLKRLERIRDLATLKTQAMMLISKPSAKPMRPEKVEWFKNALEKMNSPLKVIKLMYDLLLSGEGHSVVGSRSSMNPNSYRQRFNEQDAAEGDKIGNMPADKFDSAMARLKQLAGAGPLKTVWDPARRVYKNVPTAVQPPTQPKK